jgi:putative nucleotidyltransferase with HDIG domain
MKHVLFVDDEPDVLEGLRDSLRSMRREWKMRFAPGGEAALELLAQERFDVVVSDMRMPGMDGATFLRHVQERQPQTVRIVLSGYAELEVAVRAAAVAHLFLAKPCPGAALKAAIERACCLQSLLLAEDARRATAGAAMLPSRPEVYAALREAVVRPDVGAAEIAAIVEQDIAMCAKVLQLVNSAFFGLGRPVTSISEAVGHLGIATLESLVVSAAAFTALAPDAEPAGFEIERLQAHGARVARIARRLLPEGPAADEAFTAAMLHDVGKLVLAAHEPEELRAALEQAAAHGRPLHDVERERRGTTHAEVGAYLLGLWGLPHAVVEAVAHHHAPDRVAVAELDPVLAVHLANQLANEAGSSACAGVPGEPVDERLIAQLGLTHHLPGWRAIAADELQPA